jgi:CRP-like cAMP-binding protein
MAATLTIDPYIIDTLMPDLVGHDRRTSSFLVYLCLWRRAAPDLAVPVRMSHQALADATGLSRSAVQAALSNLWRRSLVVSKRGSPTAVPRHTVLRPSVRRGRTA